jgi:hypothetical protein
MTRNAAAKRAAKRARDRRAQRAAREQRKRGQYRRTFTIPGTQLLRLAELGYLERVADPAAQAAAFRATRPQSRRWNRLRPISKGSSAMCDGAGVS